MPRTALRPTIQTSAPAEAKRSAIPRPIPCVPPTTKTRSPTVQISLLEALIAENFMWSGWISKKSRGCAFIHTALTPFHRVNPMGSGLGKQEKPFLFSVLQCCIRQIINKEET